MRPLLLLLNQTHLSPKILIPQKLVLSSRWMLIMAQPNLLASTLMIVASVTPRVINLAQSRNPQGLPRPDLKSLLILSSNMRWCRALPRATILTTQMTLSLP